MKLMLKLIKEKLENSNEELKRVYRETFEMWKEYLW